MTASRSNKSTNVRSAWFRLGLRVAGDTVAGRLAERAFTTPRRRELPPADAEAWDAREPMRIGELAAWSWGRGPAVLLVHGWEGRAAQLAAFVAPLVEGGMRVVAFDAPAHGASPGRRATLAATASAIVAAEEAAGGLRAIVAHSFGAAASLVALSRGVQVDRAALLAPAVAIDATVSRFAAALELAPAGEAAFRARLQEDNGAPLAAFEGLRLAPMMTARLLVVHDRGDREVPFAHGEALARAWPRSTLVASEGLGHNRLLLAPAVVAQVSGFLGGVVPGPRRSLLDQIERELFDRDLRLAS